MAKELDIFGAKIQANYINQLDLKQRSGFGAGLELAFLEILYLRAGYYNRTTCDFGYPEFYRDNIQSFTYGVGLRAPLDQVTKLPLRVELDFAKLPQPSYIHTEIENDDFISANVRLSWIL